MPDQKATDQKARFIYLDPAKPVAVWWPVTVHEPVDSADADTGLREARVLNLRFVAVSDDKVVKLLQEGGELGLLKHVVVGWDLKDEAGAAVPFEQFEAVASVPYVQDGMIAGYRDFIGRGPTKN